MKRSEGRGVYQWKEWAGRFGSGGESGSWRKLLTQNRLLTRGTRESYFRPGASYELTPENEILMLRDLSSRDLYALDMEPP